MKDLGGHATKGGHFTLVLSQRREGRRGRRKEERKRVCESERKREEWFERTIFPLFDHAYSSKY